ncbi:MAG: ABC transporter ATP-binding protein [Oscillospiraceae bacterium]|nr:ABC transporter ATP-binding protein [Oscillospiraceae bacterium]
MIELMIEHASVNVNGKQVLQDVQMHSEGGMVFCIGAGGSGKTTLCRLACGLIEPTTGKVWMGGRMQPVSRHTAVLKELTLRQAIHMQKRLHENAEPMRELAEVFEMTQLLGAHWYQLTALQKALAALLLAFSAKPDWLVCDDLSYGLSETDRVRLLAALHRAATESGTSVLWISGNERDAEAALFCYRLEDGHLKKV